MLDGRTQVVVMVIYSEDPNEVKGRWQDALASLGEELRRRKYLSYLDSSSGRLEEWDQDQGMIVCRSLWDIAGTRLSVVSLIDLPTT